MGIQSNPAILNTQGEQKLIRYGGSSCYPNVYGKRTKKGSEKPFDLAGIRYIPCSILPSWAVYPPFIFRMHTYDNCGFLLYSLNNAVVASQHNRRKAPSF